MQQEKDEKAKYIRENFDNVNYKIMVDRQNYKKNTKLNMSCERFDYFPFKDAEEYEVQQRTNKAKLKKEMQLAKVRQPSLRL